MQQYLIFASVSGGLDSFTSVLYTIDEIIQQAEHTNTDSNIRVYLTNFYYGQRHSIEYYFASIQYEILQKLLSKALKNKAQNIKVSFDFEKFDISFLGQISRSVSALIKDSSLENPEEYIDTAEPLSVVPNRNFIFANILLAKVLAVAEQFKSRQPIKGYLVFGIHQSPYLDTKPEFKAILQSQAHLLTGKFYDDIDTPFKSLDLQIKIPFLCSKKEDVARAFLQLTEKYKFNWVDILQIISNLYKKTSDEMYNRIYLWLLDELKRNNSVLNNRFELITYSCYNGQFPECNACATCREKREAFEKARIELEGL